MVADDMALPLADQRLQVCIQDVRQKHYSYEDFHPYFQKITHQAEEIKQFDQKLWSAYQRALVQLDWRLTLYFRLRHTVFHPNAFEPSIQEYLKRRKQ